MLTKFAESIRDMLVDSAFFLLLGIILAGFIHHLLNETNLFRLLKENSFKTIFKAAILGIPLPLCSCSVLPVAHQLRKSGLNRGGTTAFLISTPETGIDSILLTYSLCDPIMTLARPISAFITAISAGLLLNNSPEENQPDMIMDNCDDKCCPVVNPVQSNSIIINILNSFKYAFGTLVRDLAPYLLVGYLLAGLVSFLVGGDSLRSLPNYLTSGWGSYIGAVIIGLPMYICATSSTPLAAVLLVAGFSPGSILVFLLVGPATNIASLTVVSKMFDKKSTIMYLTAIIVTAILCGLILDFIYNYFQIEKVFKAGSQDHQPGMIDYFSAFFISFFIIYYSLEKWLKKLFVN
ncbi:SO_0444 family Cu/Zn efflux transporter [Candidatus Zixiibacteriota bacterium]